MCAVYVAIPGFPGYQITRKGAVLITWRMLSTMTMNRREGFPMGTPETAMEIRKQRRAAR